MDDLSISVLQEIENLLFHVELKYTWAIQGDHNNLRKFIFAPDKFIKIYTDFPDLSGHEIGSKLINENNFDLKFIYEDLNTVTMQFRVSAERRGWLANKND